jgi:hypothetical protein
MYDSHNDTGPIDPINVAQGAALRGRKKILWWILVVDLCGCVLSLLTIMVMLLLLLTIVAIF